MSNPSLDSLSIWCLMDGKAGHQNQVLGCADAIQRRVPADIHPIELVGWNRGLRSLVHCDRHMLPAAPPDLIIGAGHASHVPLCMFHKRFGGQTVVLMKPSLPLSLFDACLIPDVHKLRRIPGNTILTKGVLNRVLPGKHKDLRQGMFLVGGPSPHYKWAGERAFQQIYEIVTGCADVEWTIATSRRTPEAFSRLCDRANFPAKLVLASDVGTDWLPAQLDTAGTVWVTEDSVSMMYEALTSGARVGVLELVRHRRNRVTECIDTLVDSNLAVRWSDWQSSRKWNTRRERFFEAERCAELLLDRMFPAQQLNASIRHAA